MPESTNIKDIDVNLNQHGVDEGSAAWEEYGEKFRKSMDALRKQNPTIDAVKKKIYELRGRMSEFRKETHMSDLEYGKLLSEWQQTVHQLRMLGDEYKAVEQAERDAGKAAEQASKDQQKASKEAQKELEKQRNSIVRLVKKSVLWAAGTASLYYLWRKLRTEVINSIKEVYQTSESYAKLTEEIENTQHAIVLFITDYSSTIELMNDTAKFLQHVQNRLLQVSSATTGFATAFNIATLKLGAFGHALRAVAGPFDDVIGLAIVGAEKFGLFGDSQKYTAIATAAAQAKMQETRDALAMAGEEAKEYSSQISSLISRMRSFNDAAAEQAQAINDIQQEFRDASAVARGQYASSLMQIEIDLQKQVSTINSKALASREKAYADYQAALRKLQADGARQRQSDAERHALEMEFARRRHNLTLLQNERIYQYERGLLVAEGDVLAIEDLDARYALERQASEENFALQQEQAEAMYQLQARIQEESMRDQVAILQQGLRDQLAEIERNRREEIAEAEAAAQEKEAQAADEYATALATAMQNEQDQLKAQKEGQAEREQALAEFLVEMLQEMGVKYEDALNIAKRYFDVGGSFDSIMQAEWQRQAQYIQVFTDAINDAINRMTVLGNKSRSLGGRTSRGLGGGGHSPYGGSAYAHGTDQVVSSPTPFTAGDRGRTERVTVQPMTGSNFINGNIGISWNGGAIPINGTGNMSGGDFDALSQSLARGIVISLQDSLGSLRNRNT